MSQTVKQEVHVKFWTNKNSGNISSGFWIWSCLRRCWNQIFRQNHLSSRSKHYQLGMGFWRSCQWGFQYRQHCRSNSYLSKWRQLPGKTEGKRWYLHRWNIKNHHFASKAQCQHRSEWSNLEKQASPMELKPATDIVKAVWNYGDAASGANNMYEGLDAFHQYDGASTYSIVVKAESIFGCKPTSMVASHQRQYPWGDIASSLGSKFCDGQISQLTAPAGVQFGNGIQRKVLLL